MEIIENAPAPAVAGVESMSAGPRCRLSVQALRLARGSRVIEMPDCSIDAGQMVGLVGPSGSGKTTALMALSLMHRPSGGKVLIDGFEPWSLGRRARDRFRGRHIGLVFQSFHLVNALDVRSNIALAARCANKPLDRRWLDQLLAQMGLTDIADRRTDRISHGQAQRVAVARALLNRPSVILADEPTSALDDRNAETLLALLKASAASAQAALLIASHDRRVLDKLDHVITIGNSG